MPTLRIANVPKELYECLRQRAGSNRHSISAETLSLLEQLLPSTAELRRRAAFYRRVQRLRSRHDAVTPGPSAEQMLRADRRR
jgi:plasmid stability protein